MACAAFVHVGPLRQSFWALYEREQDELRERTRMRPRRGEVVLEPRPRCGCATAASRSSSSWRKKPGIEALCPHGRGMVWTRKQAGVGGARAPGARRRPGAGRSAPGP